MQPVPHYSLGSLFLMVCHICRPLMCNCNHHACSLTEGMCANLSKAPVWCYKLSSRKGSQLVPGILKILRAISMRAMDNKARCKKKECRPRRWAESFLQRGRLLEERVMLQSTLGKMQHCDVASKIGFPGTCDSNMH